MSGKPAPSDLPIHAFPSISDLETFLEDNHTALPGFYLKLAKKSSGIASVSAADAVEVALCFGWIDGRASAYDQDWWLVRYTPRRPKSLWSKKNVVTTLRLIKDGRLRPAGMACVEAAQLDGRWDRAYDGSASITVPQDLATALAASPTANRFFDALNRTDRYSILHRLQTAAPRRRAERIDEIVKTLAREELPNASQRAPSNVKTSPKSHPKSRGDTLESLPIGTSARSDVKNARRLRPRKPRE